MADENSLLVEADEGTKSLAGKPSGSGLAKLVSSPARIVGVIILAVLLVLIVKHYRGVAEERQLALAQAHIRELELAAATKAAGSGHAASNPVPADPVLYGKFMISTDHIEEVTVPAGYSIEFGVIDKLAIGYYADGRLVHTYTPNGESPRFKFPQEYHAGFRIPAGQAVSENQLGYVIYIGETPPKNWWARALTKPNG